MKDSDRVICASTHLEKSRGTAGPATHTRNHVCAPQALPKACPVCISQNWGWGGHSASNSSVLFLGKTEGRTGAGGGKSPPPSALLPLLFSFTLLASFSYVFTPSSVCGTFFAFIPVYDHFLVLDHF